MPAVHSPVGMDWREYIGGHKCSDRCSKLRKKPSSARGGGKLNLQLVLDQSNQQALVLEWARMLSIMLLLPPLLALLLIP